jgi:tRNA 2-thiouridine synthesizing protein C
MKTCFIQHKAPFSTDSAQENLDALLVASSFGHDVSILFQDDGVYQIIGNHDAHKIGKRNLSAQFSMLDFYDITTVWVDESSLKERNILATELNPALTINYLNQNKLRAWLDNHDWIMRF